ncbi:MAG TPA: hypothetical protein VI078_16190 [bacterium]
MGRMRRRWLQLLLVAGLSAGMFGAGNARAQQAPLAAVELSAGAQDAAEFSVSPPLQEIVPAPAAAAGEAATGATETDPVFGPVRETPGNFPIPRPIVFEPGQSPLAPPAAPELVLYDAPMPGLDNGWQGLNQGVNRALIGVGLLPADTNGAASATHYIQMVNTAFVVYDLVNDGQWGYPKAVYGPARLSDLWAGTAGACATRDDGDPVVAYDEAADRWLLSQFAIPNYPNGPFYQCIAVSATGNPLGKWYRYTYSFDVLNDYPKFGVWTDGYYMSINQFKPWANPSWAGEGVAVFERARMLAGDPAARMIYIDTYDACVVGTEAACQLGGMLPSDLDGPAPPRGTPNYFVQFDDDAWGYSGDQLQIWRLTPNWTAGTATFAHVADLPVNSFDSEVCTSYNRLCIPQPGTTQRLDAIADRLMYRLQYRNFGDHQSLVVNHTVDSNVNKATNDGHAGIRWYELRNTGSGWSVHQQGDHAPDAASRWMGSMAMDKDGNIALGYSVSDGASIYPSIRFAGRLAGDTLNQLPQGETVMLAGTGNQTSSSARWGDYSSLAVGPDGCSFFYTTEYGRVSSLAEWYTYIGNFHYPGCLPVNTTITKMPPAFTAATTASFTFGGDAGSGGGSVVGFECSLDGGAFAACTSPKSYAGLAYGVHTFRARARDSKGYRDETPATYAWTRCIIQSFRSSGAQDGWILETGEPTGVGGSMNSAATTLVVGDSAARQQYRSILSFDTSALPDGARIRGGLLKTKLQGTAGVNPFTTHGNLLADIRMPYFGSSALLQASDFQAAAGASGAAVFGATARSGWYSAPLGSTALRFVNKRGTTQLRLRFTLDDNDDAVMDVARFFSGNDATAGNRPTLLVYYLP